MESICFAVYVTEWELLVDLIKLGPTATNAA